MAMAPPSALKESADSDLNAKMSSDEMTNDSSQKPDDTADDRRSRSKVLPAFHVTSPPRSASTSAVQRRYARLARHSTYLPAAIHDNVIATRPESIIGPSPPESRSVSNSSDGSATSKSYGARSSFSSAETQVRKGFFKRDEEIQRKSRYFSASAQNRESVMNLGSIVHLQYYFAKTGLLDGRGGQLARPKEEFEDDGHRRQSSYGNFSPLHSPEQLVSPGLQADGTFFPEVLVTENGELFLPGVEGAEWPPKTTYRSSPRPKPPTSAELKQSLLEAFDVAEPVVAEARTAAENILAGKPPPPGGNDWYCNQGNNFADVVTAAMGAAKKYYQAHEMPQRLAAIAPQGKMRPELHRLMWMLELLFERKFENGVNLEECARVEKWLGGVRDMLKKEEELEEEERRQKIRQRASWSWFGGDWTGRELAREFEFLKAMDASETPVPAWTPASEAAELPTDFLRAMADGQRLVGLHNKCFTMSKKTFSEKKIGALIKEWYADTGKPYARTHNLQAWIKEAELRWDIILEVDVAGVVHGDEDGTDSREAWLGFEKAIFEWCGKVREEIVGELIGEERSLGAER